MAHGSLNYMDDVPIVVSDKWKIPPLPDIPNECVAGFYKSYDENYLCYDYCLENKVIEKVQQWKDLRIRQINERDERIKLREEEKQKQLVAEGTKLKEQLTQVSYPSPDEFGSDSDDDEQVEEKSKVKEKTSCNFNSILTPTVVNSQASPNEITKSDLEALSNATMSKTSNNVWTYNKNANKLELAEFENDASDPFYNMELKTIDDLDILAQVLKTSVVLHSKVNDSNNKNNNDNKENTEIEEKPDDTEIKDIKKDQEPEISEDIKQPQHSDHQNIIQNGYTMRPYTAVVPQQFSNLGYASSTTTTCYHTNINTNLSKNYYDTSNNYLPVIYSNNIATSNLPVIIPNSIIEPTTHEESNNQLRSKSVPDIVKELEDEIKDSQQRRRIRNKSQCQEEKNQDDKKINHILKNMNYNHVPNNIESEQKNCDDTLLEKLPNELREMAFGISQMGFPLDRVCRIAQQVQGDDKKIIEHLIPLTELLDLGFEEKTISDALLKFDNNKEKALDFLIS